MYKFFTKIALHHGLLGEVSVRLATQGTGQALVSLLVATVTHRVVQVPPGALATPRGPGATVLTYTTVLALPPVFRNGCHDRFQTESVVAFITHITHQHLTVVTGLPAHLTYLAVRTLPASSDDRVHLDRWMETVAMVMMSTARTEQLFMYISYYITHNTKGFLSSYSLGLVCVIGTQQ